MGEICSVDGESICHDGGMCSSCPIGTGGEELGVIAKSHLNALARMFYKMQGYNVEGGYDFSKANHPQEKQVWNQAVVAWVILKEETAMLKHQIKL